MVGGFNVHRESRDDGKREPEGQNQRAGCNKVLLGRNTGKVSINRVASNRGKSGPWPACGYGGGRCWGLEGGGAQNF